jgi:hypothetical protein
MSGTNASVCPSPENEQSLRLKAGRDLRGKSLLSGDHHSRTEILISRMPL